MSGRSDERVATAAAAPWYARGLRFECTGCGRCCTGGDGYVWVDLAEVERLALFVGLPLDEFGRRYLRKVGDRLSLIERAGGECVFLRDGACAVYAARPRQCASFPFWSANLASEDAWAAAARECEGICDEAPLIGVEQIERVRADGPRAGATCSSRR